MAAFEITLVRKDTADEVLRVTDDETVIEAARRAGVILPVGCRDGGCGTCAGLVLEAGGGDGAEAPESVVEYRRPPRALDSSDRESGLVLLCVAEPRMDCRIAVGAAVWSRWSEDRRG